MSGVPGEDCVDLCHVCQKFRDVDLWLSQTMKHHRSFTELSLSATNGCTLCRGFVLHGQFRTSNEYDQEDPPPQDYDNDPGPCDPQLYLEIHDKAYPLGGVEYLLVQRDRWKGGCKPVFVCRVEVLTEADDPLATLIKGRPLHVRSDSNDSETIVKQWIQSCRDEHPLCQSNDCRLPTRVINVNSSDDPGELSLMETNGKTGEWVTLSHCWGAERPLQTTLSTLEQHRNLIPLTSLPPLFRDAVSLTRTLGFQYLWIDSLCIIQDSQDDWLRESSNMHSVYSGAQLCISAAAAWSSAYGLFTSADARRQARQPFHIIACHSTSSKLSGWISLRASAGGAVLWGSILHMRAWAFQESILSPRRLDYASSQLYWSCRTLISYEGSPGLSREHGVALVDGKDLFQMPISKQPHHPDRCWWNPSQRSPMAWWGVAVGSFLGRAISNPADMLPAIAGIAKKIQERTGYQYKCGLWIEDMQRCLLWQTTEYTIRLKDTQVPSWSWASIQIPATYRYFQLDRYKPDLRATIVKVNVITVNGDEFSQVSSASLVMHGHCRSLDDWDSESRLLYNKITRGGRPRYFNTWDYQSPQDERPLCTFDEEFHATAGHSNLIRKGIIFFLVGTFAELRNDLERDTTIFGLILEPIDPVDPEFQYRRIGIVQIARLEDASAQGWKMRNVTVV